MSESWYQRFLELQLRVSEGLRRTFVLNVGNHSSKDRASYPRRHASYRTFQIIHIDSVKTGPVRRQHQDTDSTYSHHTGLHKNYNNKMILAILL